MPAGDPAGYLPNVVRKRKRLGQPAYQPRKNRKRFGPVGDKKTGGTMAPPNLSISVPRPEFPTIKNPRRDGYPQEPPQKRARPGMRRRPIPLKPGRRGGRRHYLGRGD